MADEPHLTKYTIYEALEQMVERIGWSSEQQKLDVLDALRAVSRNNGLGVMSTYMACEHPQSEWQRISTSTGGWQSAVRTEMRCGLCGRKMD